MAGKNGKAGGGNILLKKEEVVEGGHHGGAWKVAYADFVTAMMAFFLLMWLINATTQEQRIGLADYFAPTNVMSHQSSGVGKPFSGASPAVEGGLVSNLGSVQVVTGKRPVVPETEDDDNPTPVQQRLYREGPPGIEERTEHQQTAAVPDTLSDPRETPGRAETAARPLPNAPPGAPRTGPAEARPPSEAELRAEIERRERESFERAAQQIREAVQSDPALAELARQLAIDITPEGLRIQLMDEERQPMFALGSAVPNERARALLAKIAPVLARLPLPVSIAGHTDATPYRGSERSNWELSAERANATRRVLTEAAMPEERIRRVTGHADRDLLLPGDPLAAANRRIAILVMHSARADAARTP